MLAKWRSTVSFKNSSWRLATRRTSRISCAGLYIEWLRQPVCLVCLEAWGCCWWTTLVDIETIMLSLTLNGPRPDRTSHALGKPVNITDARDSSVRYFPRITQEAQALKVTNSTFVSRLTSGELIKEYFKAGEAIRYDSGMVHLKRFYYKDINYGDSDRDEWSHQQQNSGVNY